MDPSLVHVAKSTDKSKSVPHPKPKAPAAAVALRKDAAPKPKAAAVVRGRDADPVAPPPRAVEASPKLVSSMNTTKKGGAVGRAPPVEKAGTRKPEVVSVIGSDDEEEGDEEAAPPTARLGGGGGGGKKASAAAVMAAPAGRVEEEPKEDAEMLGGEVMKKKKGGRKAKDTNVPDDMLQEASMLVFDLFKKFHDKGYDANMMDALTEGRTDKPHDFGKDNTFKHMFFAKTLGFIKATKKMMMEDAKLKWDEKMSSSKSPTTSPVILLQELVHSAILTVAQREALAQLMGGGAATHKKKVQNVFDMVAAGMDTYDTMYEDNPVMTWVAFSKKYNVKQASNNNNLIKALTYPDFNDLTKKKDGVIVFPRKSFNEVCPLSTGQQYYANSSRPQEGEWKILKLEAAKMQRSLGRLTWAEFSNNSIAQGLSGARNVSLKKLWLLYNRTWTLVSPFPFCLDGSS